MKLTVKTLKGGKFQIEADAEKTVAEVKSIIVSAAKKTIATLVLS